MKFYSPKSKLLALILSSAFSTGAFAADITIGSLFPLSGSNSAYGDIFNAGVNLAVEQINENEMLDGKLVVKQEDSKALPQPGVVGMNKLVKVYKAPYVLTGFTGVSKAMSVIGQKTKTVGVNGGGVGPDLAELGEYFWNVIPLVNEEIKVAIPYVVKEMDLKSFVLVYVDDPFGNSVKDELGDLLKENDGELKDALSIPVSMQQFSGVAAKIRSIKPDAVYIATYGTQQAQLIKQLRDSGIKSNFVSYSALGIPEVQKLKEAEGSVFTSQYIDLEADDEITKNYVKAYQKKNDNKMPSVYTTNYYNAVMLFAQLAKKIQDDGKDITGENLLKARNEIKTFDLAGGQITFKEDGTVFSPIQINKFEDNEIKVIHKEE